MTTFKINDIYEIVCEWKKTRTAFKHEAELLKNGQSVAKTKICYLNRTWERYKFESVLNKLLEKTEIVSGEERRKILDVWANDPSKNGMGALRGVAMVAMMGEVFGNTQKEKNDWKTRMLKAGLRGFVIPEDWSTLDESEKEKRLNAVIKEIKK